MKGVNTHPSGVTREALRSRRSRILPSGVLEYRSVGVLRSVRIAPRECGVEMPSGRISPRRYPELKPWAVLYGRFAAKSDKLLGSICRAPNRISAALSASPCQRSWGVIRTWHSTPTLPDSITPRVRIQGGGRERSPFQGCTVLRFPSQNFLR
jgi:hypothetical protein